MRVYAGIALSLCHRAVMRLQPLDTPALSETAAGRIG
jgi:hypothetical protein